MEIIKDLPALRLWSEGRIPFLSIQEDLGSEYPSNWFLPYIFSTGDCNGYGSCYTVGLCSMSDETIP